MILGGPGRGPETVPGTVDEIADALRRDPILISEMMGNGSTAQLDAALHAKLEQASYPVYVVLTRTPIGMEPSAADEDLVALLHGALGKDGVYVVQTSLGYGAIGAYGDLDPAVTNDATLISLARYTALDQVTSAIDARWGDTSGLAPATEAAIVLDVAARTSIPDYKSAVLSAAEVASYTETQWHKTGYAPYVDGEGRVEPVSVGLSSLVAVSVCLVVAAVAYRLLRAAVAVRAAALTRTPTPTPMRTPAPAVPVEKSASRPATVVAAPFDPRGEAERALADLVDALERAGSRTPEQQLELATGSLDVARSLLAEPGAVELDLVGAMVLARIGAQALRVSTTEPYRCCFVNPTHGRGGHRADLAGGLSVPVCRPCQRDFAYGRSPDALLEPRRGADRPYYAGDTVWARTGYGALTDELWSAVRDDRKPHG